MFVNNVEIHNVDGTHVFNLNSDTAPLADFDVTVNDRSDNSRYRQQAAGAWPTRSYDGVMSIHVEGALFADDSPSYVVARKQLIVACRGLPGTIVTSPKRGTLKFQPAGESEMWCADFGPTEISSPVQGNYPALTNFLITFGCFEAWFYGASNPANLYQWS